MPNTTDYINSADYKDLETKIKELKDNLDDLTKKSNSSRKLRYVEIDVEAEKAAGKFQPDELYIPQHIIDTNIRREQSPYVQYITQSPRAVILEDLEDDSKNAQLTLLEKDLTKKLRYDGWQLPMFANIDSFQQNGYSIMEVVLDTNNPGELGVEAVQYGDFAFTSDTRDLQAVEMTARTYYFTKTRLIALCGDGTNPTNDFNREEVDKVIDRDPDIGIETEGSSQKDRSLYKIYKVMFRIDGIVNVAWCCPDTCDDWLRIPRPLFIGRKEVVNVPIATNPLINQAIQQQVQYKDAFETNYPYILFPYLISENDTISQLKGRVFLDQDLQEGVTSLMSSTVTKARRSAGMYFSKDVSDPNDDLLMQKNIFFKSGCVINSKIQSFSLDAPDPGMFSAIQMLVTANQNETSQVSFAANNRKDSRKTAEEIRTANQQQQVLSTVQVVLFSIALTQLYRLMVSVIRSRVIAGLIQVDPILAELYKRKYAVKPAGDTDVIERQQRVQSMMNSWPVIQNTPFAQVFLMDLIELLFPEKAASYKAIVEQNNQMQQSQQAQQVQGMQQEMMAMSKAIVELSKHSDYFSDLGKLHALPIVQQAANQIQQQATPAPK